MSAKIPEEVERAIVLVCSIHDRHGLMIGADPKRVDNEMWETTQRCKEYRRDLETAITAAIDAAEERGARRVMAEVLRKATDEARARSKEAAP